VVDQERHLSGTYVPKKGLNKDSNPGVNQLQSTVGGVIKVDEVAGDDFSDTSSVKSFKPTLNKLNQKDQ